MIVLKADNRSLVRDARYTYLSLNHSSGSLTVDVVNAIPFSVGDLVLIGEIGFEQTEVKRIDSISGNQITLTSATSFYHTESSKIYRIPYDRVRFYWTSSTTYSTSTPVGTVTDITPDEWFTSMQDASHTTGYGWYVWDNSVLGTQSGHSNPIPYARFGRNTVKNCLDSFISLLNNNDRKLISPDDMMEWMNEGYDEVKDSLGMSVKEFDASDGTNTVSVVSGTSEYALDDDFSEMLKVWGEDGDEMDPIGIDDVDSYRSSWMAGADTKWYIRGGYLGFVPTPTSDTTCGYRYLKSASRLVSYHDTIDLPKKGFNLMKDWMLFRAGEKLQRRDYLEHYKMFTTRLEEFVARSINRDRSQDCWSIDSADMA